MHTPLPETITRDDLLQAIADLDAGIDHPFGHSMVYDVLHEGRRYPPKAVVGLAATRRSGRVYGPHDFTGGIAGPAHRLLHREGFTIVRKWESTPFADEVEPDRYAEGAVQTVLVNRYERDSRARADCIAHYGARCQVCTLAFPERYRELGKGFIHVHHLIPLSKIGEAYRVDPIRDLRPVCPNCHAMLHQRRPEPFTIEELRERLLPG